MATAAGALLHGAVGRGEPNAALGAFAVFAFAMSLRSATGRRALVVGAAAGLATWLPSSGLVVTGAENAGTSRGHALALALAISALHGARLALAAVVAKGLQGWGAPIGVATALAMFAAEAVDPAPVPWSLGAATVDRPWLSAAADIGGPALAGLVLALLGGVIADALAVRWTRGNGPVAAAPSALGLLTGREARGALAGGLLFVGFAARGALATRNVERAIEAAPRIRVAAVHTDWRRGTARPGVPLLRSTVFAAAREADVVVLPEALLSFDSAEAARDIVVAGLGGSSADVLVGVVWGQAGDAAPTVNALGRLRAGGNDVDWYVKSRPFPIGEANAGLTAALGLAASASLLAPGDVRGVSTFDALGHLVAPAICWEDMFADAGRAAAERPAWIAVAANDGWFASADPAGDLGAAQHLLHARLRAIEARRSVVRATNLGATAIVDPLGRVVVRAPGARYVATVIPLLAGATVAIRTQDAISPALAAIVIAIAASSLALRGRVRPRAS